MAKVKDVVALLRVSTAEQAGDDRAGLGRQREVIKRTVTSRGLNCLREIVLSDVSGTNVRNCPEVIGVLDEIRQGCIQGLVVADLDRLVRPANIEELALLQVFQDTGAIIYSGDQEIDLSSDSGYLMGGIQALLAGHELRLIKRRMQGAKEVKRREGKCPGSSITLPTGVSYDRTAEKYSYNADVSKVVEAFRIIDEEGVRNLREIGRRVGVQSRTLANLLRNPIFTGYRVYLQKRGAKYPSKNGRQSGRRKMPRAANEVIRVKVIETPAVAQDRFDRIQHVLNAVKHVWSVTRIKGGDVRLGVGIARCGVCGDLLFCSSGKRKNRVRKHGYYFCKKNYYLYRQKTGGCEQCNLRQADVDTAVEALVTKQLTDESVVSEILKVASGAFHATPLFGEVGVGKALEVKIAELRKRRARLLTGYEEAAIDLATYRQRSEQIDSEIKVLEEGSSRKQTQHSRPVDRHAYLREIVLGATAFARAATAVDKKTALTQLFSEIRISSEGITGFRLMPQFYAGVAQDGIPSGRGSSPPPA